LSDLPSQDFKNSVVFCKWNERVLLVVFKKIKSWRETYYVECHFEVTKYLDCPGEINYAIVIFERGFKGFKKLLKENASLKKC
jgi:hypothetical protein